MYLYVHKLCLAYRIHYGKMSHKCFISQFMSMHAHRHVGIFVSKYETTKPLKILSVRHNRRRFLNTVPSQAFSFTQSRPSKIGQLSIADTTKTTGPFQTSNGQSLTQAFHKHTSEVLCEQAFSPQSLPFTTALQTLLSDDF